MSTTTIERTPEQAARESARDTFADLFAGLGPSPDSIDFGDCAATLGGTDTLTDAVACAQRWGTCAVGVLDPARAAIIERNRHHAHRFDVGEVSGPGLAEVRELARLGLLFASTMELLGERLDGEDADLFEREAAESLGYAWKLWNAIRAERDRLDAKEAAESAQRLAGVLDALNRERSGAFGQTIALMPERLRTALRTAQLLEQARTEALALRLPDPVKS